MSTGVNDGSSKVYKRSAAALERECDWFNQVAAARLGLYFKQEIETENIYQITPPDLNADRSEYARLVTDNGMGFDQRLVLILALIPHIKPQLLDIFLIRNSHLDRGYTEFGGQQSKTHSGFLPTLETAVFLLAGEDLAKRFEVLQLFDREQFFTTHDILRTERSTGGEPLLSAPLAATASVVSSLTTGVTQKPDFSSEFPARLTTTRLGWDDLVLPGAVMVQIDHINAWLRHSRTILEDWGLDRNLKPGFRCLFHGPPGTGKTLTATLIGATAGADVYRIDLSMLVSKYIGETEKNLANVFDQAQDKNWILFFDEADALFGKRTKTNNSNDRHANREISYLLQRVEDFPGVVILATNLHANIDEAFARRFQSVVYFPMPDAEERLRIWHGVLGDRCRLSEDVDMNTLSSKYNLSGGAIINVVRYGAINALRMKRQAINSEDLLQGIRRELSKEGRTA
jgi:hypothetical protein